MKYQIKKTFKSIGSIWMRSGTGAFIFFLCSLFAITSCKEKEGQSANPQSQQVDQSLCQKARTWSVKASSLSIREKPDRNSERIAVLSSGSVVTELERVNQPETIDGITDLWLKIEADSSTTGWVFGGYLRATKESGVLFKKAGEISPYCIYYRNIDEEPVNGCFGEFCSESYRSCNPNSYYLIEDREEFYYIADCHTGEEGKFSKTKRQISGYLEYIDDHDCSYGCTFDNPGINYQECNSQCLKENLKAYGEESTLRRRELVFSYDGTTNHWSIEEVDKSGTRNSHDIGCMRPLPAEEQMNLCNR